MCFKMKVCVFFSLFTLLCVGLCGSSTHAVNCTAPVLSVASLEVEYGQPANVTCSIQKKPDTKYNLGWESKLSQPLTDSETSVTWEVKELTNWEEPEGISCYFTGKEQCGTFLNLTVYKKPDSVNLRSSSEVCVEGKQIELRCEVVNVGPGRILSVRWSRADPKQNNFTIFNESSVPELKNETKNVSITVNVPITPTREDDGAQYQCEALLNLNQPLVFKSEKPITISVHYKKKNFYWLLFLLIVPIVLGIWAFILYRRQHIGQYILRHLGVSHANQNTDGL